MEIYYLNKETILPSNNDQIRSTQIPPTTVTNTQKMKLPNHFDVVEVVILCLIAFILGIICKRYLPFLR